MPVWDKKSENIFESRMGLIVIPADYEKRSDRVVPVCIRAEDDLGNRIAEGWIHGVVRVADAPCNRPATGETRCNTVHNELCAARPGLTSEERLERLCV